jgi:hypothetical protein
LDVNCPSIKRTFIQFPPCSVSTFGVFVFDDSAPLGTTIGTLKNVCPSDVAGLAHEVLERLPTGLITQVANEDTTIALIVMRPSVGASSATTLSSIATTATITLIRLDEQFTSHESGTV